MNPEIVSLAPGERTEFFSTMLTAAGVVPALDLIDELEARYDLDSAFALVDGGRVLATLGVRELTIVMPGGAFAPTAAIGQAGVRPGEVGRGHLRHLITGVLDRVRESSAFVIGTTTEWGLYRRYGYGIYSFGASLVIERARLRPDLVPPPNVVIQPDHLDENLAYDVARVHKLAAQRQLGGVARSSRYWAHRLHRVAHGQSESVVGQPPATPCRLMSARHGLSSELLGVVMYRINERWVHGRPSYVIDVVDLVASTSDIERALWAHLLTVPLVEEVRLPLSSLDPLARWLVVDGRSVVISDVIDHGTMRVFSAVELLSARRYSAMPSRVTLQVNDVSGLSRASTVELIIDENGNPHASEIIEMRHGADIEIDVSGLGALVMGGRSVRSLLASEEIAFRDERSCRSTVELFSVDGFPFADTFH
jgi:predicted acetyltransferase